MRVSRGLVLCGLLGACASAESPPALTVTPAGSPVQVTGPTLFTADPASLAASVQWSLTGPGSLSGTTGRTVVYRPVASPDPAQTATLTATAGKQTAAVTIKAQPAALSSAPIAGLRGAVTVEYDAEQIPHVFCANQLDCYAAQGYLQAQDRLFQMDFYRRVAKGQLASLIGANGVPQDQQLLTLFTTRDGQRIQDALVAALDADTRSKLDAFASGVNAYLAFLAAHPTQLPAEYSQISNAISPADIAQWTAADTLAVGRLQQFQLSETIEKETGYGQFALVYGTATFGLADPGRVHAYIRAQQPLNGFTLSSTDAQVSAPPSPNSPHAQREVSPELIRALAEVNASMRELGEIYGNLRDGVGSNNWVVDGAHSVTGHSLVANDPHLSLEYPPLFHLLAMTSSDANGLNVAGGSFPGIPGALVGRGAHVGWGVTVVGYDVTDVYQETYLPPGAGGCPSVAAAGCVSFNSAAVPLQAYPVTINVRNGGMTASSAPSGCAAAADGKSLTCQVLMVPHHGPIIHFDPAHATVLSARWTGQEITNDEKAFLDLNNAASVDAAFTALKNYSVGAQNFVLADDAGHIGYDPHALVPRRAWLENPANWGDSTRYPWLPLPGTGTAEWGSGTAGDNCAGTGANLPAAACWVPDAQLPQGKDPSKGYFATANSDPAGYTASPYAPFGSTAPAGLYPYLSFDWDDPTDVRYSRIAEVLASKTSAGKVSVADMQALQSDHLVLLAKLFAPTFPAASTVPAAQQAAYGSALTLLTTWGSDGYDCPTGLTTSDPVSAPVADATQLRDSAGCFLFHTFLATLLHNVFDDDFAVVAAKTGSFSGDFGAEVRGMLYMLQSGTPAGDTTFCNDVNPTTGATVTARSCNDQVVAALVKATGLLQHAYGADSNNWLWGRAHTLTTQSPLAPLINTLFSAGPYARPGGALTVDVGNPNPPASNPLDMHYSHGSNVRFTGEMSADATPKMQLPGPERDAAHGLFANDPDLFGQYVRNQYFDYFIGHQVDAHTVATQGFTAP